MVKIYADKDRSEIWSEACDNDAFVLDCSKLTSPQYVLMNAATYFILGILIVSQIT